MRRSLFLTAVALLAVAATAVASTVTVKPGWVYTGKTAQGIAIRLGNQVSGSRWFRYRATMSCSDGSTFLDDYFSDDVPIKHNRFSVSYTSNAGAVSTKVTGTLVGMKASGTIRIIERYSEDAVNGITPLAANGSIVCSSKSVKWTAKAA